MFTKIFLLFFLLTGTYTFANAKGTYYVNTRTLKVRVAPTTKSTHSYSIYKNYKVRVHEMKNGWARISRYKTTTENGNFVKKAKWVYAKFITPAKYKKKIRKHKKKIYKHKKKKNYKKSKKKVKLNNKALKNILKSSDNYDKYAEVFQTVSQKLINDGTCKIKDFKKMRGWVESSPTTKYFTYCGGFKKSDKIYLNVVTGEVSKRNK